jgi:hypothetical protein
MPILYSHDFIIMQTGMTRRTSESKVKIITSRSCENSSCGTQRAYGWNPELVPRWTRGDIRIRNGDGKVVVSDGQRCIGEQKEYL